MIKATRQTVSAVKHLACAMGLGLKEMPSVFPKGLGQVVRPLALGVHSDLVEIAVPVGDDAKVSIRRVRRALGLYVDCDDYHRAVAEGGSLRFDLEVKNPDPVSVGHRSIAHKTLREREEAEGGSSFKANKFTQRAKPKAKARPKPMPQSSEDLRLMVRASLGLDIGVVT